MSFQNLDENEQKLFNFLIEDLQFLFNFDEILSQDIPDVLNKLKSDEAKAYINSLSQRAKPETALREAFFAGRSILRKYLDVEIIPEINLDSGFVDYIFKVDGRVILVELKSLFEADFERGKVKRLKKLRQKEIKWQQHKDQVLKYIKRGSDFIILTNLKDWFFFNKDCNLVDFNYFFIANIFDFVEEYNVIGDLWEYLRRKDTQTKSEGLDKRFFESLKIWVAKLSEIEFDVDEKTKVVLVIRLINKFIFIQTLDDFFVIDARWIKTNWDDIERKWQAKGKYKVLKEYFGEIDKWFYEYYDTELFRTNILTHIKKDSTNIDKLYDNLKLVLGLTYWQIRLGGFTGVMQYNFRYIDEDIFGKAYETFLAEVRHDAGIYYTPKYITEYIVENTVGKVYDNLLPRIEKAIKEENFDNAKELIKRFISIRVLDPACGSGSFLIKAVRIIMDNYRKLTGLLKELDEKYNKYDGSLIRSKEVEEKVQHITELAGIVKAENDRELISRLLVRHIHGNDLDSNALEVAKVNMWLEAIKMAPTEFRFDKLPVETNHILPNLGMNLVSGDAVVGLSIKTNIYNWMMRFKNSLNELVELRLTYLEDPTQSTLVEKMEVIKNSLREKLDQKFIDYIKENDLPMEVLDETKPLYWPLDFWYVVFDSEGEPLPPDEQRFDVVIGNPPYIDSETMTKTIPSVREYCTKVYDSGSGNWDIFCIFIENSLSHTRDGGQFGYIIPNKLLGADYADATRNLLKKNTIQNLRDYSQVKVFDAAVYPIIMIVKKQPPLKDKVVAIEVLNQNEEEIPAITHSDTISLDELYSMPNNIWSPILDPTIDIFNKIVASSPTLDKYFKILGAATVSEAYEISDILIDRVNKLNSKDIKFINTGTIDKYVSLWGSSSTQYIKHRYKRPVITSKDLEIFSKKRSQQALSEKVIVVGMGRELEAVYDFGEYLAGKSTTIIKLRDKDLNLKAVSGIINSTANTFVYRQLFGDLSLSGGYMRIGPPQLKRLPLPIRYVDSKKERDNIENLVDKLMLYKISRLNLIALWNHWSLRLKNSERVLVDLLTEDLRNIQEGKFKNTWTSNMSFAPSEKLKAMVKKFHKFKIEGDIAKLNIKLYGIDEDNREECIYEIDFNEKEPMIHIYFSILSSLKSRTKIKTLSALLKKTKIAVIQPKIIINTRNIVKKTNQEFEKMLKKDNNEDAVPTDISSLDNEIKNIEAQIDAIVFKMYNLNTSDINTVMDSLGLLPSYQQLILKHFK